MTSPRSTVCSYRARKALQTLGSRSQELTQLVANTNATTAAIASQSTALEQALSLLPPALNHTTRTFAGLRKTLDSLDPLVAASKPASRRLAPFAKQLDELTRASIPTIGALNDLIRNPSGSGDLITLLQQTPALARVAHTAFPELIRQMNQSQNQLDYLVDYAPDIVAALTNLGQARRLLRRQRPLRPHAAVLRRLRPGLVQPADEQAALAARRRRRRGADSLPGRGRAAVPRRLIAGERPGLQSARTRRWDHEAAGADRDLAGRGRRRRGGGGRSRLFARCRLAVPGPGDLRQRGVCGRR